MRYLVTGSTGYIGKKLTQSLFNDGNSVACLVRSKARAISLEKAGVTVFVYDGTPQSVARAFEKTDYDTVFHLASVSASNSKIEDILEANIKFGTFLLSSMSASASKRLVNVGTYWQNSFNTSFTPNSLYAATKQAYEDIIEYYSLNSGIRAITLRLHDVYGKDDFRGKVFQLVKLAAMNNESLDMTNGEQFLRPVHIFDVLSAFYRANEIIHADKTSVGKHEVYWVAGKVIQLKKLIEVFVLNSNLKVTLNWDVLDTNNTVPTNVKIGNLLPDWTPEFDLTRSIGID